MVPVGAMVLGFARSVPQSWVTKDTPTNRSSSIISGAQVWNEGTEQGTRSLGLDAQSNEHGWENEEGKPKKGIGKVKTEKLVENFGIA